MSDAAPRPALQQRVVAAILQGATQILSEQGEQASMTDVAEAAGVARATVYRYFPTREALLAELARAAVAEIESRLTAARLDEVAPEEGVARAIRALVDVGDSFVLFVRGRGRAEPGRFEHDLKQPLQALLERGQALGEIRDDITGARLSEALIWLIVGVLTSAPSLGREDSTATITRLFLDGARARGPRPV
jgi:TetR/AcrR family transcriptional regulator, mexCD-oprJ operon repressor